MKPFIFTLIFLTFSLATKAQQITYIPDSVFEQVLINQGIDSDSTLNGQILTNDAEAVNKLVLDNWYEMAIHDLTGLEDFIYLDTLILRGNILDGHILNVSTLTELRYLDCVGNSIRHPVDLSNNPLLEVVIMQFGSWWEATQYDNFIKSVDLSHNPNIKKLVLENLGVQKTINLNNGNNDSTLVLKIGMVRPGPEYTAHVCIKVDNPQAAQNNAFPYSAWTIKHPGTDYTFTDNLQQCVLGVSDFQKNRIGFYPNPARNFIRFTGVQAQLILEIYALSGQQKLTQKIAPNRAKISIGSLSPGLYLYRLHRGNRVVKTGKLVKR